MLRASPPSHRTNPSRPRARGWAAAVLGVLLLAVGIGVFRVAGAGGDGPSADLVAMLDSLGTPRADQAAAAARFKPGAVRLGNGSISPPAVAGYGVMPVRLDAASLPDLANPSAGHHYAVVVELEGEPPAGTEIGVAATDVFELPVGDPPEADALALVDSTEAFRFDVDGGTVTAESNGATVATNAFGIRRGRFVAVVIPEGEANSIYVWVQVGRRGGAGTGGYRLFGPHPLP